MEYSYRVINDETLSNLYVTVASTNFSYLVEEEDIDYAVLIFHDNLLQMYNEFCPIKTNLFP